MADVLSHSVFVWPILACGAIALLILLERAWYLYMRAGIDADTFVGALQKAIVAGNFDRAMRVCLAEPAVPAAQVARAALLHAHGAPQELALAVESAVGQGASRIQRRVAYLPTLANVATLFGLLGTILGLIQSFDAVSQADPSQRQSMLAEGISLAMTATATGIAVAIPSLIGYALLAQRANHLLDDLERVASDVQLALTGRRAPAPADGAGPSDAAAGEHA